MEHFMISIAFWAWLGGVVIGILGIRLKRPAFWVIMLPAMLFFNYVRN